MAVDSPPGRMRAAQEESSEGVRTSMNLRLWFWREGVWVAARWRREMCSTKAPWRARTPIVRDVLEVVLLAVVLGEGCMMMAGCFDPGVLIGSDPLVLS